jgi:hypothetical protein
MADASQSGGPAPKDPTKADQSDATADSAATESPATSAEDLRARYGAGVVIAGLVVVALTFFAALIAFDKASSVSTALAGVTGVIGTIVGAYFGVQVGSEGKARADENARVATNQLTQANEKAAAVATLVPPQDAPTATRIMAAGSDWGSALEPGGWGRPPAEEGPPSAAPGYD